MTKRTSRSKRKNTRVLPVKGSVRQSSGSDGDENPNDEIVAVKEQEDDQDRLDILCGPGISSGMVLSNCLYLQLICEHAAQFGVATSGREKAIIASEIVEQARVQNGRFLKKVDDGSNSWFDIGNQVAVAKTFRQLSLAEEQKSCNVEDFLDYNALGDDDSVDRMAWVQVSKAFEDRHDLGGSDETAVDQMPVEYKATVQNEDDEFELVDIKEEIIISKTETKPTQSKATIKGGGAKSKQEHFVDEATRLAYERLLSTPQKNQLEQLRTLKASDITDIKAASKIITIPQFNKPIPSAGHNVALHPSQPSMKRDPARNNRTQASSTSPHSRSNKRSASTEDGADLSLGVDTPESVHDYPSPAPDGGWRHPAKPKFSRLTEQQGFSSPVKPTKRQKNQPAPGSPPPPPKIERKISGASQLLANNPISALPFLPSTNDTDTTNVLSKPLEYLAYMAETQRSPFNVKKFLSQHPGALPLNTSLPPLRLAELDSAFSDVAQEDLRRTTSVKELSDEELRHSLFGRSIPQDLDSRGGDVENSRVSDRPKNEVAVSPLKELNTTVSQDLACQMADDDDARWCV